MPIFDSDTYEMIGIDSTDPTMDAAHSARTMDKYGFEEYGVTYDSTQIVDYDIFALIDSSRRAIEAERSRERRKFGIKKLKKRGRKQYLEMKACKGCGNEFQPRSLDSAYCQKSCFANKNALWLEIDGCRKTVKEWAEIGGVTVPTIKSRLQRGWPVNGSLIKRDAKKED